MARSHEDTKAKSEPAIGAEVRASREATRTRSDPASWDQQAKGDMRRKPGMTRRLYYADHAGSAEPESAEPKTEPAETKPEPAES